MTERSDKGCTLCPLACGADRALSPGVCGVGGARGIGERDPYETAFVARARGISMRSRPFRASTAAEQYSFRAATWPAFSARI